MKKKIALKLLKENQKLFQIFKRTVNYYLTQSLSKYFILRFLNKILFQLNLKLAHQYFSEIFYNKYYNLFNFESLIQQYNKKFRLKDIKIVCQDFTDNSPWLKKISSYNRAIHQIYYPHTTNIYSSNNKIKIKKN